MEALSRWYRRWIAYWKEPMPLPFALWVAMGLMTQEESKKGREEWQAPQKRS